MTTQNPYDVNFPGKFETAFAGFEKGFYAFRLVLGNHKKLDACMFQMEVSQWLFDNAQGKWYMGNDFPYADHPKMSLYNPNHTDYFVLFEQFVDVVAFEDQFPVNGLSPSMLV